MLFFSGSLTVGNAEKKRQNKGEREIFSRKKDREGNKAITQAFTAEKEVVIGV
jgi:hypothetical protein